MPQIRFHNRLLDVRPDKLDLRDRPFRPQLTSLPPAYPTEDVIAQYLPAYRDADLILNQGREGACTGFGLACVINFLQWSAGWRTQLLSGWGETLDYWPDPREVDPVSPRMLYHLARFYDEWPGEDYSGSSCRGAMRGWHRHGVCRDELWPYRDDSGDVAFVRPQSGWQNDAATRRVGAYYRVATPAFDNPMTPPELSRLASVDDLQAAIFEVGAVYASASVHEGWMNVPEKADQLPVIEFCEEAAGGHAFALIGYTPAGFIVQNSWGWKWGYHGFAILTYQDWATHGYDAWVAALGARVASASPANYVFSTQSRAGASGRAARSPRGYVYRNPQVKPWSEAGNVDPLVNPHRYCVVVGNNGVPLKRLVEAENGRDAVRIAVAENFRRWHDERRPPKPRIALFLHGGLTNEENGLQRSRHMGPYFSENGIYPLFVNWKTGILETVNNLVGDAVRRRSESEVAAEGIIDRIVGELSEAKDRALEVAAEHLVKPFWTQMKQNARLASKFPDDNFDAPAKNAVAAVMQHLVGLARRRFRRPCIALVSRT